MAWVVAALGFTAWMAGRRRGAFSSTWVALWRGTTEVPWRAVLITLAVMLVLIGAAVSLAGKYHVFGTDKVGQDVLYLSLKSVRTGLVIGTLTTLVMLPFALLLGVMAGYFRGWVDDVIQYVYTTLSSIPGVLLIAAFILMMQVYVETHPDLFDTTAARADIRLLFLCLILGVTSWTGLCRLLRGETLKLREMEYIQAAHAFGVSRWRVITRHILPNVMHIVLIAVAMDFSGLVLSEAVLSYVGVGVDPSMISFGTMINAARLEMAREPMVWWSLAAAFLFMLALVLRANLFADAVRMPSTRECGPSGRKPPPGMGRRRRDRGDGVNPAQGVRSQDQSLHRQRSGARRGRTHVPHCPRRNLCAAGRIRLRQVHDRAFHHAPVAGSGTHRGGAVKLDGVDLLALPEWPCAQCGAGASR